MARSERGETEEDEAMNGPAPPKHDDLYLLESIASDITRSEDERAEAANRLLAELDMRTRLLVADARNTVERMIASAAHHAQSLLEVGDSLQTLIDREFAALSPAERGQVVHLIEHEDECILDAICRVKSA
jgi:hypothetical protein